MNKKKEFICEECNEVYYAKWTRGLCSTCRTQRWRKKNWKANNPYEHYADPVAPDHVEGEWMPPGIPFGRQGRHPIINRGKVERQNNINREYFQQQQRLAQYYDIDLDSLL